MISWSDWNVQPATRGIAELTLFWAPLQKFWIAALLKWYPAISIRNSSFLLTRATWRLQKSPRNVCTLDSCLWDTQTDFRICISTSWTKSARRLQIHSAGEHRSSNYYISELKWHTARTRACEGEQKHVVGFSSSMTFALGLHYWMHWHPRLLKFTKSLYFSLEKDADHGWMYIENPMSAGTVIRMAISSTS